MQTYQSAHILQFDLLNLSTCPVSSLQKHTLIMLIFTKVNI
jgi:hypothetical protein